LPCATLVGIGYVDRARITLRGTDVKRIEIVELQQ
jgi:diphthamide biosynthesis methyltransferase